MGIMIRLGAGPAPGADREEDAAWAASVALARRDILAEQAAGIDHGLAADNLRLLDRIDALIGTWSDGDWDELARRRVTELVVASKRGRQRGRELRKSEPQATRSNMPRVVGCCATRPTTGCVRRPRWSLTRSAGA